MKNSKGKLAFLLCFVLLFSSLSGVVFGEAGQESEDLVFDIDGLDADKSYDYALVEDDVVYTSESAVSNESGVLSISGLSYEDYVAVILNDAIYADGIDRDDLIAKFGLEYDDESGKYAFPSWNLNETYTRDVEFESEELVETTSTEVVEVSSEETEAEEQLYFSEINPNRKGLVISKVTNMYLDPSSDSQVIDMLHAGDEFIALGYYSNGYLSVSFNEKTGCVLSDDTIPKDDADKEVAENIDETESEVIVEETESEIIEETESETEGNDFDYIGKLNVEQESFAINSKTGTYQGDLELSYDLKSTGDVVADSAKGGLSVQFPQGTILSDSLSIDESGSLIKDSDNNTIIEAQADPATGKNTIKFTDASVNDSTLDISFEKSDVNILGDKIVLHGNNIAVEMKDPKYILSMEDSDKEFENEEDLKDFVEENFAEEDKESADILEVKEVDVETNKLGITSNMVLLDENNEDLELPEMESVEDLNILKSTITSVAWSAFNFNLSNPHQYDNDAGARSSLEQIAQRVNFSATDMGSIKLSPSAVTAVSGGTTVFWRNRNDDYTCGKLIRPDTPRTCTVTYANAAKIVNNGVVETHDVKVTYRLGDDDHIAYLIGVPPSLLGITQSDVMTNANIQMIYSNSPSDPDLDGRAWYTSYNNMVHRTNPQRYAYSDETSAFFKESVDFTIEVVGARSTDIWMLYLTDIDKKEFWSFNALQGMKGSTNVVFEHEGGFTTIMGTVSDDPTAPPEEQLPSIDQRAWVYFKGSSVNGAYGAATNGRFGSSFNSTITNIRYHLTSNSDIPTQNYILKTMQSVPMGSASKHTIIQSMAPALNGYTLRKWTTNPNQYDASQSLSSAAGTTTGMLYAANYDLYAELKLNTGSLTLTKSVVDPSGRHTNEKDDYVFYVEPISLDSDLNGARNLPVGFTFPGGRSDYAIATTNSSGSVTLTGMPYGTYKVTEKEVHGRADVPYWWDVSYQGNSQNVTVSGTASSKTTTNTYKTGCLKVTKNIIDASGFHKNDGNTNFSIRLYGISDEGRANGRTTNDVDKTISTGQTYNFNGGGVSTGTACVAQFNNIPIGTYTVVESYPSYSGSMTNIWIPESGTSQSKAITYGSTATNPVTMTFTNRYKTGNYKVYKQINMNDSTTSTNIGNIPLNGFKFRVYGTSEGGDVISQSQDGNGTISFVAYTNAQGVATFSNLPIGTNCYTLVEEPSAIVPGGTAQIGDIYKDLDTPETISVEYQG